MSATYYAQNEILNTYFGKVGNTIPSVWYLGFSSDTPVESTGACTELSGGGYARVGIPNASASFVAASNGVVHSKERLSFPTALASWGTASNILVYDALTGGNLWFYSALPTPLPIPIDSEVTYLAELLNITLNNP